MPDAATILTQAEDDVLNQLAEWDPLRRAIAFDTLAGQFSLYRIKEDIRLYVRNAVAG